MHLTMIANVCDRPAAKQVMCVKGEIVFPNNLKELRVRKRLTQAQLGRLMEPPVGESTISKMESGERRLTNLQLANLATILGCEAEEIPVVTRRDPSAGVQRWQKAQQEAVRRSIESGAAATGYVKTAAAWLIEHSGFSKGYSIGPAGLSTRHTLALVNRGGATAEDVLRLARNIRERVYGEFGISLIPEPVFVGFEESINAEFLVAPRSPV